MKPVMKEFIFPNDRRSKLRGFFQQDRCQKSHVSSPSPVLFCFNFAFLPPHAVGITIRDAPAGPVLPQNELWLSVVLMGSSRDR